MKAVVCWLGHSATNDNGQPVVIEKAIKPAGRRLKKKNNYMDRGRPRGVDPNMMTSSN